MTIGNRKTIAFELLNFRNDLIDIRFYLGNKLISEESVYMPTYSFENMVGQLRSGDLRNDRLNGLTPTEIVKKIEDERYSNEHQFFKHLLKLDETIDQYSIYVLEVNGITYFNWYCWDEHNCNKEHKLNEIYSAKLPTSELIATLEQLRSEMKK